MPTIKVSGKDKTFTNVYYVDPTSGVDAGSGTETSPFLTIPFAVSKCLSSGDAVYLKEGTHTVGATSGSYGAGGLDDAGKSITFVGVPNSTKVVADGTRHTDRDHHAVSTVGAQTELYNIILDLKVGSRTATYATSFFGHDAGLVNAKAYNCVFLTDATSPSLIYDNGNTNNVYCYNCVFIVNANFSASYSGGARPTLQNCVSNYALPTEGVKVTNADTLTFNLTTYVITSDKSLWVNKGTGSDNDGSVADLGVYGGTYAWSLVKPSVITITRPNDTVAKNTDHRFDFKVTAPVFSDATIVTKAMIDEGVLGTGRTLSGVIDKNGWTRIDNVEVKASAGYTVKRLIRDGGTIKTISSKGWLVTVGSPLTEDMFNTYGMGDLTALTKSATLDEVAFVDGGALGSGELYKATINQTNVQKLEVI